MLDPGLTASLLASYGRLDDLMHYATLRQACSTGFHKQHHEGLVTLGAWQPLDKPHTAHDHRGCYALRLPVFICVASVHTTSQSQPVLSSTAVS